MVAIPKCAFITLKLSYISHFVHNSIQDECYHHVWINNRFGISSCHHQGRLCLPNLLGSVCEERSINLEKTKTHQEAHKQRWHLLLGTKMHTVPTAKVYVHGCSLATCNTQLRLSRLRLKSWLCPGCVKKRPWLHQPPWSSDTSSTPEFLRLSRRMHCLLCNVFYKSMS